MKTLAILPIAFEPHPIDSGIKVAKVGGYSIATGKFIEGYEVLCLETEERHIFNSLSRVERFIEKGK
jgi:hypothetical protein